MWKSLTQISPLYIQIKQRLDKTNKDPQMYFKSKKKKKKKLQANQKELVE